MEKKTIGKFISVLRKANGMTQQELGDKLLVSDKTVSKWERDERMPDISLLPAIAEIFGITVDELLRGERNNPEREGYGTEETEAKQTAKSEKQFNNMLEQKKRRYYALTCISLLLMIVGLIVAVATNSLGAIIGEVVLLVAQFCQIIFAVLSIVKIDDDERADKVGNINTIVVKLATIFTIANLTIAVFCYFFIFDYDPAIVLTFVLPTLIVLYSIYALLIRKKLYKRGLITMSSKQEKVYVRNDKLFKKMLAICGTIAIVGCTVGLCVINYGIDFENPIVYDNVAEFKETVESEYDQWLDSQSSNWWYEGEDGMTIYDEDAFNTIVNESIKKGTLLDENGNGVCSYYCLDEKYLSIEAVTDENGQLRIEVLTRAEAENASKKHIEALTIFGYSMSAYLAIVVIVYVLIASMNKKKVNAEADEEKVATQTVEEEMVEQAN